MKHTHSSSEFFRPYALSVGMIATHVTKTSKKMRCIFCIFTAYKNETFFALWVKIWCNRCRCKINKFRERMQMSSRIQNFFTFIINFRFLLKRKKNCRFLHDWHLNYDQFPDFSLSFFNLTVHIRDLEIIWVKNRLIIFCSPLTTFLCV